MQSKDMVIKMSGMLRKDREITDVNEMLEVIKKCTVMRLGLCDDGEVYIVPMNFGYTYENEQLIFYFHGAVRGRKYDIIKKNPKVGFELECDIVPYGGDLPCQYGMEFSSIIGNGIAEMIDDPQEKIEGIKILMQHQSGKDFEFTERLVSVINVFKVTATSFTCKRRKHGG